MVINTNFYSEISTIVIALYNKSSNFFGELTTGETFIKFHLFCFIHLTLSENSKHYEKKQQSVVK